MGRSKRKQKGAIINGILLLDKPLNISSNRALQRARGIFNAQKAGHTGSLDPLASGMLPVCFGEATKVSSYLLDSNKRYTTIAKLGETTDTGDAEGTVISTHDIPKLAQSDIETILEQFRGDIQQTPPMHSALKHNGKPLYELARQGIEIERKVRNITIHSLNLLETTSDTLTLDVTCSKGTYIRSLVEDIGNSIGCGAYVSYLRRTEVDPFNQYPLYKLEQLEALRDENKLDTTLLPLDYALPHLPAIYLDETQTDDFLNGRKVLNNKDTHPDDLNPSLYRTYTSENKFIGLGFGKTESILAPKRIFHL